MKIHLVSGFLGSGKTTAIEYATRVLLQQGIQTGVITNDQGIRLVDGGFFEGLKIPHRQVTNGCFCCNYNDLDSGIQSLAYTNKSEVIFAESVGSCTDIVATVAKPLLYYHPDAIVSLSTFADVKLLQMILKEGTNFFDETVRYIYLKQLEEAVVIIINKIDLVSKEELVEVKELMQIKYGNKVLLYQNSFSEPDISLWLNSLDNYTPDSMLKSLNINYDTYAQGEEKLAWLDQELEIYSAANNALGDAESLVNVINKKVKEGLYPIGHLKFLINGVDKISFTPGTQQPAIINKKPAATAALLMNIRVQTEPQILTSLITGIIKEVEMESGCKIVVTSTSAFKPGYPRPTHRI